MSNPTGRTGKRTAVRTATRTIVYYRTADGKPSRTLEITPKGHRYFSTATKREIEQAGGAPAKAGFVSKNPRGKKYRQQLISQKGRVTDLGTARSEDGAHTMIAIAYDSMTPAQRRGVKWRILKE